jgi:hypothetical protein
MVYLQLSLLAEVATAFKVSLKSESAQSELVDLFGQANGIGPFLRSGPRLVGGIASLLLTKGGLRIAARIMPIISAPLSAYVNNRHIQKVGSAAISHFEGWMKAHEKTARVSGR